MTHQVNDKFSQPLYNDDGNICSDDVNVILEMHADNTNNCINIFHSMMMYLPVRNLVV